MNIRININKLRNLKSKSRKVLAEWTVEELPPLVFSNDYSEYDSQMSRYATTKISNKYYGHITLGSPNPSKTVISGGRSFKLK